MCGSLSKGSTCRAVFWTRRSGSNGGVGERSTSQTKTAELFSPKRRCKHDAPTGHVQTLGEEAPVPALGGITSYEEDSKERQGSVQEVSPGDRVQSGPQRGGRAGSMGMSRVRRKLAPALENFVVGDAKGGLSRGPPCRAAFCGSAPDVMDVYRR